MTAILSPRSFCDTVKSFIKTSCFFMLFCSILPVLVISYTIVSVSRKLWLCILNNRYPYLEFATTNNVRSLVDTSRNPGVFHILLQIEGKCDLDEFKSKFQEHVLERKDKYGRICFPRLKLSLVSCWGQYAWVKNFDDFDINNHILMGNSNYRGRPITEANIQEYISETISKYMPPDIAPWQIICIPTILLNQQASTSSAECDSSQPYYYMLVRMHHLLMEEEPYLNISDILMIDLTKTQSNKTPDLRKVKSPFMNLMEKPIFIPKLYNCLTSAMINRWNEFIYHYDPLESPDIDKKSVTGILQFNSVLLICVVTIIHDFWNGFNAIQRNPLVKLKFLKNLIERETTRRHLSFKVFQQAILTSINPLNIATEAIKLVCRFYMALILMVPCFIYNEIHSLRTCLFLEECLYPNTVTGFLFEYVPMVFGALRELKNIFMIIVTAPRLLFEELFENNGCSEHYLQNVSLCGRKVVSWSEKVDKTIIKNNSKQGINDIDILLAATSLSFKEFFNEISPDNVPQKLEISARCIIEEHLFGKVKYMKGTSGFVSLKLPISCLSTNAISEIQNSIKEVRDHQIALNLISLAQIHFDFLTKALPDVWMKLLINFLSRRFAVSLTEISEAIPKIESYETVLGQEIVDAIYLRPPQANTSISLTIQRFKSHIRLGVMADAQISPKHAKITSCWKYQLENMKFKIKL